MAGKKIKMSIAIPVKLEKGKQTSEGFAKQMDEQLKKVSKNFNQDFNKGMEKTVKNFGEELKKQGKVITASRFNAKVDAAGNVVGGKMSLTTADEKAKRRGISARSMIGMGTGIQAWLDMLMSGIKRALEPLETLGDLSDKLADIEDFATAIGTSNEIAARIVAIGGKAGMDINVLNESIRKSASQRESLAKEDSKLGDLARNTNLSDAEFFLAGIEESANEKDAKKRSDILGQLLSSRYDKMKVADLVGLFESGINVDQIKKEGEILNSASEKASAVEGKVFKKQYQNTLSEAQFYSSNLSDEKNQDQLATVMSAQETYDTNVLLNSSIDDLSKSSKLYYQQLENTQNLIGTISNQLTNLLQLATPAITGFSNIAKVIESKIPDFIQTLQGMKQVFIDISNKLDFLGLFKDKKEDPDRST